MPTPPFSVLDHVGFSVASLNRSIPFYTALLGEEPLLRKKWDVEYVGRVVGYPGLVLEAAFWRLPGGDKESARQKALQLFPAAHAALARKKDHGRAEASLIALYGARS